MNLSDVFDRVRRRVRKLKGEQPNAYFDFAGHELPRTDAPRLLEAADNDVARLIYDHKGRIVHKWLHYPGVYQKEFGDYRGTDLTFLEIGIFKGGSLQLWRKFFGEKANIAGLDINPDCADYVDPPTRAFIGSQADPAFLRSVIEQIGTPDIILDDGSHVASHQLASFKTLFPLLKVGGLYVIEDLHTSYWAGFYEGGYRRSGTAIEFAKTIIDDMHAWYHNSGTRLVDQTSVASVRFYDSIVVIEKAEVPVPHHIKVS